MESKEDHRAQDFSEVDFKKLRIMTKKRLQYRV